MSLFLDGLFRLKKFEPEKLQEQHARSEIRILERRIELLRAIINDYYYNPGKYCQALSGPVQEAMNQLIIERTKLEIQLIYLTQLL